MHGETVKFATKCHWLHKPGFYTIHSICSCSFNLLQ